MDDRISPCGSDRLAKNSVSEMCSAFRTWANRSESLDRKVDLAPTPGPGYSRVAEPVPGAAESVSVIPRWSSSARSPNQSAGDTPMRFSAATWDLPLPGLAGGDVSSAAALPASLASAEGPAASDMVRVPSRAASAAGSAVEKPDGRPRQAAAPFWRGGVNSKAGTLLLLTVRKQGPGGELRQPGSQPRAGREHGVPARPCSPGCCPPRDTWTRTADLSSRACAPQHEYGYLCPSRGPRQLGGSAKGPIQLVQRCAEAGGRSAAGGVRLLGFTRPRRPPLPPHPRRTRHHSPLRGQSGWRARPPWPPRSPGCRPTRAP